MRQKRNIITGIVAICLLWQVSYVVAIDSPLATVKLDHPQDTMQSFMSAMNDYRRGVTTNDKLLKARLSDAVRCLDVSKYSVLLQSEKGRQAAIYLKEVMDRIIVIDYKKIPDKASMDGEPLLRWRLKDTEIVIIRILEGENRGEYLFSSKTVERAEEFYQRVEHLPYIDGSGIGAAYEQPWTERHFPGWLQKTLFLEPNWKWIGLFAAIFIGLVIRTLAHTILNGLYKLAQKSYFDWDHALIEAIEKPTGYIVSAVFWFFSLLLLQFSDLLQVMLLVGVKLTLSISIIWALYRLVEVLVHYLDLFVQKTGNKLDDQLVPLLNRALRLFVVIFGVLVVFQNFGVNVVSILAGLGLGGLAFALAAKDTCANLFGSINILIDRPFQAGDWIIIDDLEGTVEQVGFRSTRIRTFYNSLVCVPNAIVANASIDNMGKREYRRIKAFLGITYDTEPEQVELFLEGVKKIVQANAKTRKDYFHVVFHGYGAYSLDIMLYYYVKVKNWSEELVERQRIFLEIFRLAKEMGISFAFPTQTVHLERKTHAGSGEGKKVNFDKIKDIVNDFGPKGKKSRPEGQGYFVPPYMETD